MFGRNPLRAYADIFASTLGDSYGFSETLVKVAPLLLTALAVAVPSRIWLINVGGEGQLYVGALCATWAALNLADWPRGPLLAVMALLGFAGGGAWAAIAGVLRARGWASETISTLLLNYVAILLVHYVVFGPWRDPEGLNYPQTAPFADGAILPALAGQSGPPRAPARARSPSRRSRSSSRARAGAWRCGRSAATRGRASTRVARSTAT